MNDFNYKVQFNTTSLVKAPSYNINSFSGGIFNAAKGLSSLSITNIAAAGAPIIAGQLAGNLASSLSSLKLGNFYQDFKSSTISFMKQEWGNIKHKLPFGDVLAPIAEKYVTAETLFNFAEQQGQKLFSGLASFPVYNTAELIAVIASELVKYGVNYYNSYQAAGEFASKYGLTDGGSENLLTELNADAGKNSEPADKAELDNSEFATDYHHPTNFSLDLDIHNLDSGIDFAGEDSGLGHVDCEAR